MHVIRSVPEVRKTLKELRQGGKTVGFVPTMGALHEGHLSLVTAARKENDVVVVSVFVNPTQFGPSEDFDTYPRALDQDALACEKEEVDVFLAPRTADMYPAGYATYVLQERYTEPFEGEIRTGHFHGVCTVCAKLFNIVQPTIAYFGRKDYQQSVVIRHMVRDLNLDMQIKVCPIVREADGLAMSSRNIFLNAEERAQASSLYRALQRAEELFHEGEHRAATLIAAMEQVLQDAPLGRVDYLAIVNPHSLREIRRVESEAAVLVAVRFGDTRLLDNILLSVE